MGCGKTTIGKMLAEKLDIEYFDTDAVIQNKSGISIQEIFKNQGEKLFRNWEQIVLQETLLKYKCVISTGGGLPCYNDNVKWINKYGKSVYLNASSNILANRLKDNTYFRPLLADKNNIELEEFIEEHIKQRKQFYEKATITVLTDNLSPEQICEEIKFKFQL